MSLIILLALVMAVSFALWQVTEKQTNKNSLGSACISISYSNDSANISLADAWPMTDEEGLASTPYTFTITNDCDIAVNYQVSLESLLKDNYTEDSYIDGDYIKVSLDGDYILDTYNVFPSITSDDNQIKDTKKIATGKLYAYGSKTYDLRLWLDEETPDTQMGKKFHSRIKVVGGQGIGLDCYIVNSEGTLTHYNQDCGMTATIPATVNNIAVKKIASGAFRPEVSYNYEMKNNVSPDDIAFSLLADGSRTEAFMNNDFASLMDITADEAKLVIYDEQNAKHVEEAIAWIKEHRDTDEYFNNLYSLEQFTPLVVDDIKIVKYSHLTERPNGYEMFYKVEKVDGEYTAKSIGFRFSDTSSDNIRTCDVNYVDFSNATNLEEIEDHAFLGMEMNGYTLTFPSNLQKIGESAFANTQCNLEFNSGLESIDYWAFGENYFITSVDIPASVTYIGGEIFSIYQPVLDITVHSQELYATAHIWAPGRNVIYEP